ncbi:MAG: response regulator transcription factor [Clostridium sp.]|uniref:response regulator transcription factor n=1 Tax=Clostridium culturomicium TaxID=1499683 RepID=UPI00058EB9FD|nr:response regulator transcription factor [Clostridium culturomicium]MDU4892170.1 response regulator transcription factor [Clostridium sp.]MDU7082557.1 response regulator transcription factor [Clostridium sp.]
MLINVVEDNLNLNRMIKTYLEAEGYRVQSFLNGKEAIENIFEEVELWVMDIMIPDINGFTIFKKVKELTPNSKVIFISARNQDIDRVIGLEMGCDDYIPKPFMIRELVIKVNNLLKKPKEIQNNIIKCGEYTIDKDKHKVYINDSQLEISSKEYDLLLYFMENKFRAVSREQVLDSVWGINYFGSARVVDNTLRRLRNKMTKLKIQTIYGYGYRFEGVND